MAAGGCQVVSAVSYRPAWHASRRAYRKHEGAKVGQFGIEEVLSRTVPSGVRRV